MPTDPEEPNADQLDDSSKESIKKLHSLVDELKSVEEYEKMILADEDPPLFVRTRTG